MTAVKIKNIENDGKVSKTRTEKSENEIYYNFIVM